MAMPERARTANLGDEPGPIPPRIELIRPGSAEATHGSGILRESIFINAVTAMMSAVTFVFVVALLFWADEITSPQWKYLFTFPGGEHSWAAIFGSASILMAAGLATRWYRVTAVGAALLGAASALIAVFYAVAPAIDESMVTFGWYPWLLTLIPTALGSVIYWRPVRWF